MRKIALLFAAMALLLVACGEEPVDRAIAQQVCDGFTAVDAQYPGQIQDSEAAAQVEQLMQTAAESEQPNLIINVQELWEAANEGDPEQWEDAADDMRSWCDDQLAG